MIPPSAPPEFMPHNAPAVAAPDGTATENIQIFGAAFFEAAGPALTTALNRQITVSVLAVASMTLRELLDDLDAPWTFVEATYQRGMSGAHWLVFSRRGALALAGDAEAEVMDLDTRHREAIRDAVNQVLYAAGPPLMPLFARSIAFSPVTVHVVARDEPLPGDFSPEQRLWVVHAQAVGTDLSIDLALTIDEALGREIAALGAPGAEPAATPERRDEPAPAKMDLILDVTLPVAVELGRARMQVQEILKLAPGSVIALDKSAGDPVELFINDRAIAKGEVVIIDENFGVRLTSIVTATERIRTLR